MAWGNGTDWITTQKTSACEFSTSQDFTEDATAGNRYVAVIETSVETIAEKRGLSESAAMTFMANNPPTNTLTSQTFNDTASESQYQLVLPASEGTTVRYEAVRANEANGWTIRRTTVTKSCSATWGSGSYSAAIHASNAGVYRLVSKRRYSQCLAVKWIASYYLLNPSTGEYEAQGQYPVVWNLNTVETVEEWTNLSQGAAETKATATGFGSSVITQVAADGTSWESASTSTDVSYAGGTSGYTVRRTVKTSTISQG